MTKVLLYSLGTRGDMEPFLALAQILRRRGYMISCAMPAQFRQLVEDAQFEFLPLSAKFLELIEGDKAQMVMGGKISIWSKMKALFELYQISQTMQREVVEEQYEIAQVKKPDFIFYNPKCMYPVVWGLENPGRTAMISPIPCLIQPVNEHASLGMGKNWGKFLNRFTYHFSNFFLFKTIISSTKRYHSESPSKWKSKHVKNFLLEEQPMIYTVSKVIFPEPKYWPQGIRVGGYIQKENQTGEEPNAELLNFLKKNEKVLFITFGSMRNPEPEQNTRIICNILRKLKIPGIINTAVGGLSRIETNLDAIFFVEGVSYEWLFPRVYAVLHHGGSGTTHLALKHGCANMVIPHILDQFFWNDQIVKLGAGPEGIPIRKLSEKKLEKQLSKLMIETAYRQNAELVKAKMQEESPEDLLALSGLSAL